MDLVSVVDPDEDRSPEGPVGDRTYDRYRVRTSGVAPSADEKNGVSWVSGKRTIDVGWKRTP